MSDLLATETKVFDDHREEWLRNHSGAYVAIRGDEIAGFFESYAEAFQAGLTQFGAQKNFLIEQVCQTEPAYFFF